MISFLVVFLLYTDTDVLAASSKRLSDSEIPKKSRAAFDVKDSTGNAYKLYIYSDQEKAAYKELNKKKIRVYNGNYILALFDKNGKKKLSSIPANIKTYSTVPLSNTGTVKIVASLKNQPNLIGVKENIIFPSDQLITFDSVYYVKKGKLGKVAVTKDGKEHPFFHYNKLLNPALNQYIGYNFEEWGDKWEHKWLFKPETGQLELTSSALINHDGYRINFPIFSYVKEIKFKEKELEDAVRNTLNKPRGPILLKDLDRLTTLNADYLGLTDLSGLEYARNLESINLGYNNLDEEDFWTLSDAKLEHLYIPMNDINTLDFLNDRLEGLHSLNIAGNPINTIEALRNMDQLKHLDLSGTSITDLNPIGQLRSLNSLGLRLMAVKNLSPLKGIESLERLWLDKTEVQSFAFLSSLSNLKTLSINDSFYGTDHRIDGTPLKNLKKLENLSIDRVMFKDFSFLSSMQNLKSLEAIISAVTVQDVKSNIALEHLEIQADDLPNLKSLTKLKYLDISSSDVSNLEPLKGLTELKELYASNNKIVSLDPVAKLPKLEKLMVDQNLIEELPEWILPNLEELSLTNNRVRNIQQLASLPSLKVLWISGNPIQDLSLLKTIPLETVDTGEED